MTTTMTTENLRKILDQFRALRPAPMAITVNAIRAQVLGPCRKLGLPRATRAVPGRGMRRRGLDLI
jgi:hypothetical protein